MRKLLFLLIPMGIIISSIQSWFLAGIYTEFPEWELGLWVFFVVFLSIFPGLMYFYLMLICTNKKDLVHQYLLILIALNTAIQLINMFRIHDSGFYLLSLGNIYFSVFAFLFIYLKFYVDETTFDMRVSIFQQFKVKDILFDYGYLILLSLPLKYPNVYSIIGTALVLSLLLALDFKYTKHKNQARKEELSEI